MRGGRALAAWAWCLGLAGCDAASIIEVEVDLRSLVAVTEVSQLHLAVWDDQGEELGRTIALEPGQDRPVIELWRGPRTPAALTLRAFAYLEDVLLASSPPAAVKFGDGETTRVRVVVPPPGG